MKAPHEELDSDLISEDAALNASNPIIRLPGRETDAWPSDRPVSMAELLKLIPYSEAQILLMLEYGTFYPPMIDPINMVWSWYQVLTWICENNNDLSEPDIPGSPF